MSSKKKQTEYKTIRDKINEEFIRAANIYRVHPCCIASDPLPTTASGEYNQRLRASKIYMICFLKTNCIMSWEQIEKELNIHCQTARRIFQQFDNLEKDNI